MKKPYINLFLCLFFIASVCSAAENNTYELNFIKQEAVAGEPGAELLYGLALLDGRYGLTPDYPAATQWLKKSANKDNHYAQLILANCYADGKGVKQNAATAVHWWQQAAAGGNARAQYHLGKAYLDGKGIEHDDQKAIDWLTRAAEGGNNHAQYLIGKMYHEGYVVAQDHEFARDWLSRAASNGHTDAIKLLSVIDSIYKSGTIVEQNSFGELLKRAKNGDPEAQYELAMHYKNGSFNEDNRANPERALYWLKKSANNGDLRAMKALSDVYREGLLGVKINTTKAAEWQKKSQGRH